MTLIEDIELHFNTKNLYDVLGVDKDADERQIKKAYRRVSLKVHPDRASDSEKEQATKMFQTLARVHFILSDNERRSLYDSQGIIANEDDLEGEANWDQYWRLLFPKISEKDIDNFMEKYVDSKDEEEDLIRIYNKFKGDMDQIHCSHIGFNEEQTRQKILKLIEEGKIEEFQNFKKETVTKRNRRSKRAEREAKEAEELKAELMKKNGSNLEDGSDLTALIQRRSKANFESMISSLEAKYVKKPSNKRKRDSR